MRPIFEWLEKKFSRPKKSIAPIQPGNFVRVKPDDITSGPDDIASGEFKIEVSFNAEVPGWIVSHGSGKNVLMPNMYADGHIDTEPLLKILEQSSPNIEKSVGFNPYDTAILQDKLIPKPR